MSIVVVAVHIMKEGQPHLEKDRRTVSQLLILLLSKHRSS
jgi:hypothetical protein